MLAFAPQRAASCSHSSLACLRTLACGAGAHPTVSPLFHGLCYEEHARAD